MKIKPLGARILIKHIPPSSETKEGIVLSSASINPNFFTGTILEIGAGCSNFMLVKPPLKVGSKVAYLKYGYEEMDKETHLVEEMSVIAVYE